MSASLLITGAAGFIGSGFARFWRRQHPEDRIVLLDALTYAGNKDNLAEIMDAVEFVHGDIRDQQLVERLLEQHEVDVVVNFAAESHNSLAILRPAEFFSTNVMGTVALLEAARKVGVRRFHHVSTCEVYGDMNQPLPLYSSTRNRREWLYVLDHCQAIERVLDKGRVGETYHVGSGEEADIETIADLILAELGLPASMKTIVPDRPSHDRRYLLDSSKLRTELGWAPETRFHDGIKTTVAWYRDNQQWWEPLLDRAPVEETTWR